MAAAGRESHRSSERRLLSLKDDAARPRAETTDATDESIAGGGPSELGAAGLAAGVGNVDALLEAGLERPHGRRKGKHPSKAGGKNTSSGARSTATSARVAASGGREGGKSEGTVAGAAGAAAGEEVDEARGVIKSSTRERSQLMYEQHQETQVRVPPSQRQPRSSFDVERTGPIYSIFTKDFVALGGWPVEVVATLFGRVRSIRKARSNEIDVRMSYLLLA